MFSLTKKKKKPRFVLFKYHLFGIFNLILYTKTKIFYITDFAKHNINNVKAIIDFPLTLSLSAKHLTPTPNDVDKMFYSEVRR